MTQNLTNPIRTNCPSPVPWLGDFGELVDGRPAALRVRWQAAVDGALTMVRFPATIDASQSSGESNCSPIELAAKERLVSNRTYHASQACFQIGATGVLLLIAGCGSDKVSELVDKAKVEASLAADKVQEEASAAAEKVEQRVTDGVNVASTQAQEQLSLAGKMNLVLGDPLATQACYARLIVQPAGRPSVLQVLSYRQAEQEAFPSVMLQSQTAAAAPEDLVGQTVPAEMYIQREANGAIWRSLADKPVQIKVVSLENQLLAIEIVNGALESTDAAGETSVTGSMSAAFEP